MIIIMRLPKKEELERVLDKINQYHLEAHTLSNHDKVFITVVSETVASQTDLFARMPGVEKALSLSTPYKLVSREVHLENSQVKVGNVIFGGADIPVIAGPCAIETYEQLKNTAIAIKSAGAVMLRGGAFKPRTSPYSFQGLKSEGLEILKQVSTETGLPVVTEITDPRSIENMVDYIDMFQIGARNMQNFVLLKEVAKTGKPVLLKRGSGNTVEEWLMAAEYIVADGNMQVVLCERGIRTFETATRNTLDLNAVALVKHLSHLPVIVDPSHGTGNWKLVNPMAKAAIAAGADGLMIEVHPEPEQALSDGIQSLTPHNFRQLMEELNQLVQVIDRRLAQ